MTSRSNWANDSSTLRVSRPMLLVVLKDWVSDSDRLLELAKGLEVRSGRGRGQGARAVCGLRSIRQWSSGVYSPARTPSVV
jgi:hypothetical protein